MRQKAVLQHVHKVDPDTVLGAADLAAHREALRQEAEGTLVPWEKVKQMLKKRGVHVGRRVR